MVALPGYRTRGWRRSRESSGVPDPYAAPTAAPDLERQAEDAFALALGSSVSGPDVGGPELGDDLAGGPARELDALARRAEHLELDAFVPDANAADPAVATVA